MPPTNPISLLGHDPRSFSLDQVAERLSVLATAQTGALATELHLASLCCRAAHTRWEDLLQALQDYRQERSQLTAWFDDQVDQLQQESLGLVVPDSGAGLHHLRPDAEGRYAWDRWEVQAKAAGLADELAQLGRAVMREAVQHDWEPLLKAECGWRDAGQKMLAWGLAEPEFASQRWQRLLETDGERGFWNAEGEWHTGCAPE